MAYTRPSTSTRPRTRPRRHTAPQRTFADIQKPRRKGMCTKCGTKPSTHQVSVMSRKLNSERGPGEHVASTSRNFCEDCGVKTFEELAVIVRGEEDE